MSVKKIFIVAFLVASYTLYAQENRISQAMSRFDYREAINLLAKEKPTTAIEFQKAQCYKSLMEYDKAIQLLENLTVRDSLNLQLMNELADMYQLAGKYSKASPIYKKILAKNSDNRFFSLANISNLYKMKDWEQTLGEIKKIIQNDSLPQLLSLAGDCHWQMENNDSAIYYYQRTLQYAPDDNSSVFKLARIYLQTKKYDALTKCTNDYIRIDSTNKSVNMYNGIGYCYLQDYNMAIYRLKKIYDDGDKTFTTTFFLGSSYFGRQDYYEAYDHLTEAYEKDSTNLTLIYYRGRSAILSGQFASGTALLERGLELMVPKDSVLFNYYNDLATGYSRWAKPSKAIEYYDKYLKLRPNSKLIVYSMARIFDYDLKNTKQALKYYNMFLSLSPKEPESNIDASQGALTGTYYSAVKNRIEEIKTEEFFKK